MGATLHTVNFRLPSHHLERFNDKYGFPIIQAYGMTETSPLALAAIPKSYMADWWIPDEFVLLDQIPKTSVGKFNKKELREMVADGRIKIPCQP